jgi:hypothetical protein
VDQLFRKAVKLILIVFAVVLAVNAARRAFRLRQMW